MVRQLVVSAIKVSIIGAVFLIASLGLQLQAFAQVGYTLTTDTGDLLAINAWNQSRPKDGLVLYDNDYGPTTRTNAYGLELTLTPLPQSDGQTVRYQVAPFPQRPRCQKGEALTECGNTPIAEGNLIISAHGSSKAQLAKLTDGSQVTVSPRWFAHATRKISVINPNYGNNSRYCTFPGCRGGGQLVVYTPSIGRPKTGTNEFGFEATVLDGRVVAHEGSDSTIPPEGFVLSGHGKSRDWLIANAPIGAAIQLSGDGKVLAATVDAETYRGQLLNRLNHAEQRRLCGTWYLPRRTDENPCLQTQGAITAAETLLTQGDQLGAAKAFHGLTEQLNHAIWESHLPFEDTSIKGIWHRPVEQSRAEVQRTLDFLKASGLNAVFLETFFHGYTIFPSETMAQYGLPEKNPTQDLQDPLAVWVDEAHQRGIQVHTWMETFYVGNRVAPPDNDSLMGPILGKYPQWGNQVYTGRKTPQPDVSTLERGAYFLDPANPEAKDFLLALFEEVSTKYEIDGLQLDYIRYPSSLPKNRYRYLESSWGYTPIARQQFKAIGGTGGVDPNNFTRKSIHGAHAAAWRAWQVFKVQQINQFVMAVNTRLDAAVTRPNFKISAAVFPRENDALIRKQQDWPTWVASGWVDMLNPMTLTSALKMIAADTNHVIRLRDELNTNVTVNSGLFGPFNGNEADLILQQIDVARENHADGFALFDSAHLTGRAGKAINISQQH